VELYYSPKANAGQRLAENKMDLLLIFNYTTFSVYYTYIDTVYVRILRDRGKGESVCTSGDGGDAHMMMRVHSLLFTDQFVPSPLSNGKPLISLSGPSVIDRIESLHL
jgi:hypothetical protein